MVSEFRKGVVNGMLRSTIAMLGVIGAALALTGCGTTGEPLPRAGELLDYQYVIGPGDTVSIFVWGNPEVSTSVPVRPDGRISAPLVEELFASGKTSVELARDIERVLSKYIREPLVTVTIGSFVGRFDEQVRVLGEAVSPLAMPYRQDMTLLDLMISTGGISEFAAGNKAVVIRNVNGERIQGRVLLDDLLRDGDISANVEMRPGDILIIPESWF